MEAKSENQKEETQQSKVKNGLENFTTKSAEKEDTASLTNLQIRESEYKVEKLEKECKFLEYQTSKKYKQLENLKALSGIGSILAAIFTFGTILFSIIKWTDDNRQTRVAKDDDQFTHAIASLTDQLPQKRLSAAVALKSYVAKTDKVRNSQIILSLTNALAFEENEISRNGIVDVLRSIDFKQIDSITLVDGLNSLINLDRVIVREVESLYQSVSLNDSGLLDKPAYKKIEGLSHAIEIFIQNKIFTKDMSGLWLSNLELSDIQFPNQTTFTGSCILSSKFDSATCIGCDFTNTTLCGTNFNLANLKGSDFSSEDYAALSAIQKSLFCFGYYHGPDYISANLEGCKFSNFPLDYIAHDDFLSYKYGMIGSSFKGANIDSADFETSVFYTLFTKKDNQPNINATNITVVELNDSIYIKGYYINSITPQLNDGIPLSTFDRRSNYETAKLPDWVKQAIEY